MSGGLGTLALAALAGLGFAATAALAVAALHPLFARVLRRAHPERRAAAAWLFAAAPGAAALVGLALCFAPSALGLLGLHADHCLRHAEHPHLCLVHRGFSPPPLLALGLVIAAGAAGLAGLRGARRAARVRRWLAGLAAGAGAPLARDVRELAIDAPLCFAAGLLRPRIYVSRAFARALSPDALAAALEHERAHARRRDALRLWLARALSAPQLPPVRARLLAELGLACEQACDEEAGQRVGDRLRVAEAILAAERLLAGGPGAPALAAAGFGAGSVPARVQALLADPAPRPGAGLGPIVLAAALLAGAAGAEAFHHRAEHLLGLLVRLF
jgi:hypothetical protein